MKRKKENSDKQRNNSLLDPERSKSKTWSIVALILGPLVVVITVVLKAFGMI